MSKYRNIKVCVPTREINEAVQIVLINNGVKWRSRLDGVNHLDRNFLVVDEQGFLGFFGDGRESFEKGNEKEVPYRSILDPFYDVKIAWANGEVVQYKARGEWHDWENMAALVTDIYSEWRVKPKTKTIKQWERKYLQGGLVMTMVVSGPDDSNNMECWIGEAYEAEYEVPND